MRKSGNYAQRLTAVVVAFALAAGLVPAPALAEAVNEPEAEAVEQALDDGGDEPVAELADEPAGGSPAPLLSEDGDDVGEMQGVEATGDSDQQLPDPDDEAGEAEGTPEVESGEAPSVADETDDESTEPNPQEDELPAEAGASEASAEEAPEGGGVELTAQAASDYTADDAINWAKSKVGTPVGYNDGSGYYQCVEFIAAYYQYLGVSPAGGNACDYAWNQLPEGWTRTAGGTPQKGDILVYSAYSSTIQQNGHVAIYESDNSLYDQDGSVLGATVKHETANYRTYTYNYWGCIHPNFKTSDPDEWGEEMAAGYDRVLPDGDYIIALTSTVGGSPLRFLDIAGVDVPAANGANVDLWSAPDGAEGLSKREADLWHLTYSDGFYTITQKGTNMALDVDAASRKRGTNVQVWESNGSSAQRWAISQNGGGYRLQAKCSGFSIDNYNAILEDGNNVWVWSSNSSDAQRWSFIPVGSEMASGYSRVLPDGDYIIALTSSVNSSPLWFLDIAGTDVPAANGANVNLWSADDGAEGLSARACDLWHIAYSGGFYTITQKGTGAALDVDSASRARGANVQAWAGNGSSAQKWAISNNGDGYRLQAKCSGFSLDNSGARLEGGNNIHVWQSNSTDAQRWSFIPVKASQAITASNKSVAMGKTVGLGAKTSGNGTLTYKSSNTKVATVSSKGVVTPKGVGKVTITITASATANYKAATKKVTVTVTKGTQTITASNKQVVTGKTASLGAKASGGGKLTYKSSDTKVATVDSKGTVKGVKAGTVKITITASANTNWNKTTKVVTVKVGKANPMTARAAKASVTVKYATVKTNAVVTARNVAVSKVQGTLAYTNASADVTAKKFSVNKKTGKVTVPKGTKKGTYVVKVKVTAAGNSSYIAGSKTVSYKVVVK